DLNLMLVGFNLIPAFPMDGGRVLRAVLSGWLGRLRATEIAASIGRTLALMFGFWSLLQFNLLHVLLALFIYSVAGMELNRVRAEERPSRWMSPWPFNSTAGAFRSVDLGQGRCVLIPAVVSPQRESRREGPWHSGRSSI